MSFAFDIRRATQAAAVLLNNAPALKMSYIKLIKLLYVVDREGIRENGFPVTGDTPVAMKKGPVLSRIYACISDSYPSTEFWDSFIETRTETYEVELVNDPGVGRLSPYEIDKLNEVYERYREYDQWQMSEVTHGFEEWVKNKVDVGQAAIPLDDIVLAVGCGDDIEEIRQNQLEGTRFLKRFGT